MNTPQKHKFGFRAWLPTIGLAFAAFVFNTSEFLPVGLLPNIAESLNESTSQTGLIITVYAWVVALMSLPLTVLTAKLERRKLLLGLLMVFAASHFIVLWADTFTKLMGARICVAFTHSIFWSIMTPLAARTAPFGKQALGLAAVMGGSIVATVLGVPIGTRLGQEVGWQGAFFIVGIAALVVLVLIFLVLPVSKSDRAGSLKSLPELFKRPAICQLYFLTAVVVLGQFTVYSFIAPILMNVGGIPEQTTVVALFVFGISGIIGTVIGSKFVDKHISASLVIPMFIAACSLALITPLAPHWNYFLAMSVLWGAATTAVSLAFQTILLRFARDAADVATSLFSGIFNIGIGGGAFLGSHLSVIYGFSSLGYVGSALVGFCTLGCLLIWLKTGSAVLTGKNPSAKSGE